MQRESGPLPLIRGSVQKRGCSCWMPLPPFSPALFRALKLSLIKLADQFCRLTKSSEWTHSEGIVIIIHLKLALCVVCYEYFNILIKILYVNACVGVAFTLSCAYICYFLVEELEIRRQRSQLLPCWKNASAYSLSALFQSTVSVLYVQTHSLHQREKCQISEIPCHVFTATLHPGRHTSTLFTLSGQ